MAQGRGGAVIGVAVLSVLLIHCSATTFKVGDDNGWNFNSQGWAQGKTFKTGDILEFDYNPQRHNVVVVDKAGHDSCTPGAGAKTFTTGKDQIVLDKPGKAYFICSFPGHCDSALQKLEIDVQ